MKSLAPKQGGTALPQPPILKPRNPIAGLRGKLPLKTGEVILTASEKKRLMACGWKPGQALPGNIAQLVAATQKQIEHEIATTQLKPDDFKPDIPTEVNLADLDPAHRQKLEGYLQAYNDQLPEMEKALAARQGISHLTPGVQQALTDAGVEGIEVIDSRDGPPPLSVQDRIDIAEGKTPKSTTTGLVEEEPAKEASKTPEFAKEDKILFLTACFNCGAFRKVYSLMRGRLEFTFKQLSTTQSEQVVSEVYALIKAGALSTEQGSRMGTIFRAVLSLEEMKLNDEVINVAEHLTQQGFKSLMEMYNAIRDSSLFENESVWQLFRDYHHRFQTLVEQLEARAGDPDFWDAIEG